MDADEALRRRAEVWKGIPQEKEPDEVPPPYQILTVDFLIAGVVLARAALRAPLPEELEPSDTNTGLIAHYRAPTGWRLAPFEVCFIGVDVKGYDATDGSAAMMMVAGWYSARAGRIMHENYNSRLETGEVRHWRD